MHLVLISFMHLSLFSIREPISVITSNYRLVDINFISPVILLRSLVFHDTFWTDKIHLSSANQVIFCIVQLSPFHFILKICMIWWQLKIIGSRWEIDVSYVGPKKFFSATLCGAFSLVFWFSVFDHSLWLFSSHGFHILCRLSSISFLVLVFSF